MPRLRNGMPLLIVVSMAGIVGVVAAGGVSQSQALGSPVSKAPAKELLFEANRGQADGRVRFRARGQQCSLFLTDTDAVLALRAPAGRKDAVIRMGVRGARTAAVRGEEPAGVPVRYYHGRPGPKWETPVTTYRKVRYADVTPGVDLVYYGNEGALEYDFSVAPSARPQDIALSFSGQERLQVDEHGALLIQASGQTLRQEAPIAYQERDGVRQLVDARFVLKDDSQVGFELGQYDPARRLVIDPKFVFSTFLGGSGGERGTGIAVDADGNSYVTGTTGSNNFPVTGDADQPELTAATEVFVAKYSPTGALLYASYLGGHNTDESSGIALGPDGQIYLTGATQSDDFPITLDCAQADLQNPWDAFVARLDVDGRVNYATYLGGRDEDRGNSIGVDANGLIYVGGRTRSLDFPTPAPARNGFQQAENGDADGFLVQLDPTQIGADQIRYATFLGGSRIDDVRDLTIRGSRVYLVGSTTSANFPASPGVLQRVKAGMLDVGDAWVGVFDLTNPGADSRIWISHFGGSAAETGDAIAVNGAGNIFIAGSTNSRDFPRRTTPSAGFNYTYGGGNSDAYFAVLNGSGTALIRSSYIGGTGDDGALDIAVDPSNFIYVTGYASSSPFPVKNQILGPQGYSDAFLAKIDQANYVLHYSTLIGGRNADQATGVALDAGGINAWVTGTTASVANFPLVNAAQPQYGGADIGGKKLNDAFVTKIGPKNALRMAANADRLFPSLTKECTGPLTAFTLDGSESKGFNTRISVFRWSLNGQLVGIVPRLVQSKGPGTYHYVLTATDPIGDSGSIAVDVTIVDTTPPSFTAAGSVRPANVTKAIPVNQSSTTVALGGPARGVDKCDGVITATGTRSDGQALTAPYPVGITTITWVATDASGNSAQYQQKVTITH